MTSSRFTGNIVFGDIHTMYDNVTHILTVFLSFRLAWPLIFFRLSQNSKPLWRCHLTRKENETDVCRTVWGELTPVAPILLDALELRSFIFLIVE